MLGQGGNNSLLMVRGVKKTFNGLESSYLLLYGGSPNSLVKPEGLKLSAVLQN